MKSIYNNFTKSVISLSKWTLLVIIMMFPLLASGDAAKVTESELTPAPGEYRIFNEDVEISFPFEIFRGDIRYQCEVNGKPVYMLLDDGYMWDQLLFWGSPRVDSLGFEYDGTVGVVGGGETDDSLFSKTASGITVTFPNVEFTNQSAVITPQSSGTSTMWWGSEGQLSATLLKHFVVDINFDKMMITLIKPDEYKFDGQGAEVPWKPMGFGPWCIPLTLELVDGREITLKVLMDLGYNDQLQLWTGMENKIPIPEKSIPANLGTNIQGISTMGFEGRLPRINIGGYEIINPLVAYVSEEDSKDAQYEAMIGLNLLSHFNLVFDYTRQRLIITPNSDFNRTYEYNMTGLSMYKNRDGFLEVSRVHDNSPASEAGFKSGDLIININGQPIEDYERDDIYSLLRQAGKKIKFDARRDGKDWNVEIVLRRIL
jgi:PDZ domain